MQAEFKVSKIPNSEVYKMTDYIRQHGLPAVATIEGIKTLDQYVNTKDRSYHEDEVIVPASWSAVREFLGY